MSSLIRTIQQVTKDYVDSIGHRLPSIKNGTVTSTSTDGTASVRVDGETSSTDSVTSIGTVKVGDRVKMVLFNRQLTILGAIQRSDKLMADGIAGGVGGRNLLRSSGVAVTNSTYNIRQYTMTEQMVPGATYTLRIWGSLGSGKSSFGAWINGGTISLGYLLNNNDGTHTLTFTGKEGGAPTDVIWIYALPSSVTVPSTIAHIKLERGAVATDWTPAPEDYVEKSSLLNTLYPVGSIYTTTSSATTCPIQTALGGTWVNYGGGRVLAGLDTTQAEFNSIGKTGGSKTHTLTIDQMPKHGHRTRYHSNTATGLWGINEQNGYGSISSSDDPAVSLIEHAGGGAAHNNLQPYIVVRHWRRTA